MTPRPAPRIAPRVLIGLALWLAAALVVGSSGLLAAVGPPFPQVVLLAITTAVLVLVTRARELRRFAQTVDLRILVVVHLSRFVGLYFLVLNRRDELPYAFAVPAGWGDVAVATVALALLATVQPVGPSGRGAYLGWNLVGTADILFVVATAARLAVADPTSMRALTRLPLALLPTFLVPLIIATHVVMLARLLRPRSTPTSPDPIET